MNIFAIGFIGILSITLSSFGKNKLVHSLQKYKHTSIVDSRYFLSETYTLLKVLYHRLTYDLDIHW